MYKVFLYLYWIAIYMCQENQLYSITLKFLCMTNQDKWRQMCVQPNMEYYL